MPFATDDAFNAFCRDHLGVDQKKKAKIAQALKDKGVKLPCPRCASMGFEVVGQTVLFLNDNSQNVVIEMSSISAAVVACSNCGFITLHALGIVTNE